MGTILLDIVVSTDSLTSPSGAKDVPIWSIIEDSNAGIGWLVNLGLLAMFGYVVFVFIERFLAIKRASKEEGDLLIKIKEYLNDGKIDSAIDLCKRSNSPTSRMLEKGIDRLGKPLETISGAIENTGKLEVLRLEQRISFLATASGAGPMLGFLGTVIGMVVVFIDLGNSTSLELKVIAPGIMTAMITTVEGLVVGIVAFMGHNYLHSRISRVIYQMENAALEFMDLLHTPAK
jgi:biopolymer transport protein ExbB